MKVSLSMVVRDEFGILPLNIRYHSSIGVDSREAACSAEGIVSGSLWELWRDLVSSGGRTAEDLASELSASAQDLLGRGVRLGQDPSMKKTLTSLLRGGEGHACSV